MAEKANNTINIVPNQNNINDIITASIQNISDISKVVIKAATDNTIKYSTETIDKLKTYSEVIESLFNSKGAVIVLMKAADTFQKLDGKNIKEENIKKGFNAVKLMQNYINDLISNLSKLNNIPVINIEGITSIFDNLNSLRASLEKDDKTKKPIWFKFLMLKIEINEAIKLIKEISKIQIDNDALNNAKLLTLNIKNFYKDITENIEAFNNVKIKNIATYFIKLFIIKRIIASTIKSLKDIDTKTLKLINKKFSSKDNEITELFNIISNIAEIIISSIKSFTVLLIFKKIVINGISAFSDITDAIIEKLSKTKKINKSTIDNINNIVNVVDQLAHVSKRIIILGLLAVPAIIAMAVITIGFLPAIALFIGALWVLSKTISFVNDSIETSFKSLASIIVSMLIIGLSLVGFAILAPFIMKHIAEAIIPFIISLGIFTLFTWISFKLIGKLSISTIPGILSFGLMIAILCGTLLISGLAIILAAKIADSIETGAGKIILVLLGMIALTAVLVGLGMGITALTPFIAPSMIGLGQMLGLIALILGIGLTINALANIEIESDKAKTKTNEIVTAINLIRDELKNLDNSREDRKEWRRNKRVLRQVSRTVKTVVRIAKNLNSLQKIELDKDTIISNVTNILLFTQKLQDLMNKLLFGGNINENDNTEQTGNFLTRNLASIFHRAASFKTQAEIRSNKRTLSKVDKVINKLVGIGQSLVSISEFKLTGDFKTKIEENITNIFGFIDQINVKIHELMYPKKDETTENIVNEDPAKLLSKGQLRRADKKLSKVESIVLTIGEIAKTLNILKDFKFVTGENGTSKIIKDNIDVLMSGVVDISKIVKNKLKSIDIDIDDVEDLNPIISFINSLNNGFKDISEVNSANVKNNIDTYIKLIGKIEGINSSSFGVLSIRINALNNSIKSLGESNPDKIKNSIDNYVKFVDKINTVDVQKLETTSKLFQQMSNFSHSIKGDFKELAESLGEKLLPVLEDLKEVMTDIPDKLDKGFQNTSASIYATSAPVTRENVTAQVNRENPNLSKEEIGQIVDNRLSEKAKVDANGVASKLDELISLLKGYGSENVVVQTL